MTDLTKYRKLDFIEFTLKRPDTYVGGITPVELDTYLIDPERGVEWRTVRYCPALLKIFDEVLQNSYDHSLRPEGKHLTKVEVAINPLTSQISVSDNGGIPVAIHPEYKQYVPDIIFGEMMSGENYDDEKERSGAGTNGLGSKLTNIWSTEFRVETADGKKAYDKTYSNNRRDETEPKITNSSKKFTRITFTPDYARMGIDLDRDNELMLIRRVYEIAAVAPHLSISLNGKPLDVKGFAPFAEKFKGEFYEENEDWSVGVGASGERGFTQISFVNGTNTRAGGTHVEYIADQVVEGIRAHIEKKTKQKVKPADLKNHFLLMVKARVINPRFGNQMKEALTTPVSKFGTSFKLSDKFLKKLINSDIVKDLIEWANRKKELEDRREAAALEKEKAKSSLKHIIKYEPANEKKDRSSCYLFICEGDSAKNPLMSARDPKLHGVFPLRGKIKNVRGEKISDLAKSEEIMNLKTILGLEFNQKALVENLRYRRLYLATDADHDGAHIRGLVLNFLNEFWPELLEQDFVYWLRTPIVKSVYKQKTYEFFDDESYHDFESKHPGAKSKYLKGLGSNETKDFRKFMFEPQYAVPYRVEDETDTEMLKVAFDNGNGAADRRKVWLYEDC